MQSRALQPLRYFITLVLAAALPFLSCVARAAEAAVDLEDQKVEPDNQPAYAYQKMSLQLFNDAVNSLREFHKTHPATRETKFVYASGLINYQPVTNERIQESYEALGALAKENPADDVGVEAKYLQARIEQIHRDTPNIPEALRLYKELLADQPQHPIAQRALARIIMLELYTFDKSDPHNAKKEARADELGQETLKLTDPLAIRMAEMTLCNAYFQFDWDHAKGMEHAERALNTKFVRQRTEGNFLVMVGTTAEELGQKEKALKYYKEFVAKNQRDVRTFTLQRKIREMEAAGIVAPDPVPDNSAVAPANGAPDTMTPSSMAPAPLPSGTGAVPGSDPASIAP